MPLYEFHCDNCNRDFERRRSMQEADAPLNCPECESAEVTRKLSLFVALTGSESDMASSGEGGGCGCGGSCACGSHSLN